MNRREVGKIQEERAAAYLSRQGYRILKKNFYSRHGEIDMIAQEAGYLVFVEVKYRKDRKYGYPIEAIDGRKRRSIAYAARTFLKTEGLGEETPCRFDAVSILGDQISLIKNCWEWEMEG